MKVRQGFVSNSSSSSFVIAIKQQATQPCQHCGRQDPDFLELLASADDDSYVADEGRKDILAYCEDLEDIPVLANEDPAKLDTWEQELLASYNRLKDHDWAGYKLVRVRLDDHNPLLQHVLQQHAKTGSIEILEGI